jgi:glycosyltransferase involved in cell wall biosynthesis
MQKSLLFIDKNRNFDDLSLFNFTEKSIVYNIEKKGDDKYFWEYETEPTIWISILIASYNTKLKYLYDCVKSIKEQIGNFGVELVWINDCSNEINSKLLLSVLSEFFKNLKNFKLIYNKTKINRGLSFCLCEGLLLCSNEIVFRMDSDDIMINNRIITQLKLMNDIPNCVLCGSNMISFINNKIKIGRSNHPFIITWDNYKKTREDWILNHPTLCFKKSAVLSVGNYRRDLKMPFEDLDLELRILKKYNIVYNVQEPLLLYRTHDNQLSKKNNAEFKNKKSKMIEYYCNADTNDDLLNYKI